MKESSIICFGECLWDLLPTGKVAGGAPMNVAIQLQHLKNQVCFASKLGKDELGEELLLWLESKGLSTNLITKEEQYSTGVVEVHLSPKGQPSYKITAPVAWDFIEATTELKEAVQQASVLVFGSLIARNNNRSGTTLKDLIQLAPKKVLKVFDVNLRAPHFEKNTLLDLLLQADIVKMNEEELVLLASWIDGLDLASKENKEEQDWESLIKGLATHFSLKQLLVTFGADGAKVWSENQLFFSQGIRVKEEDLKDTVGCGDAFLAAYLHQYLKGEKEENCLKFAGGMGALVATKRGGTSLIVEEDVWAFVASRPPGLLF